MCTLLVVQILAAIALFGNEWSVLYNLTDLSGVLFAHRNYQNQTDFQLR